MTRSKLLLTTSLCTALALPAFAEGRNFSQVDTNGNRQLERTEIAAAFGARSADRMLSRRDRNGDGALSVTEARSSGSDSESDDDEGDDDESDHNESDDGETNSGGHNESDDSESDDSESDSGESDDSESDDGESDDGESNSGGHGESDDSESDD